ncbi:unnamed protein product [Protopolystoma xenopodis]|uniref:Uncharacterized protein n=1 Tax=Protopolystoma xenopodis TaxID=117903 RepID=A0A448X625_9PLAT|nr:unnamed protein product [Protopolystoma xenopodis]
MSSRSLDSKFCGRQPSLPFSVANFTVDFEPTPQLILRYHVDVGPYKDSKIRAFGPGLVGGVVNKPAVFVVETNGETGALGEITFKQAF